MRAIRPAFLLVFAVFTLSAFAAQTAFPIAAPRSGPAPFQRNHVELAASSEQFLAVWHDGREQWNHGNGRAYAARISRAGVILDPNGIPVGESLAFYGPTTVHSVASNGTDFLIATRHATNRLYLTKITRDGVASITSLAVHADYANLVSLGDGYALFYNENLSTTGTIYSTRGKVVILDRDGNTVVPSVDLVASNGSVGDLNAAVSGDGATTLVIWTDSGDGRVHARTIATSTLRAGTARITSEIDPTVANPAAHDLRIVSGGDRFFVSWIQGDEYRGRIVNTAGSAIGSILTIASSPVPTRVDVAWNGSRFVAAYPVFEGFARTLHVSEFTPNGVRAYDANPGTQTYLTLAIESIGSDSLIAWEGWSEQQIGRDKIRADIYDGSSNFKFGANPLLVSRSYAMRSDPVGVWLGTHFLAAWTELSDVTRVAIARFAPTGPSLDGEGILLGSAGAHTPSIATDGSEALVAWSQGDGSYVAHVSANGIVTPRQIATARSGAEVVWNGEEYAACADSTMLRLDRDGTTKQVSNLPNVTGPCHVAWSGSQYVVLWETTEICFPICTLPTSLNILAVSRDLTPLGSGVRIAYPDVAGEPKTALAGDRMLIVWPEHDGKLRAKRITAAGSLLDAAAITIGDATMLSDVFAEGENWIVISGGLAWTVTRAGNVSGPALRYPFVVQGMQADVVTNAATPFVLYQQMTSGFVPQLYGRFVGSIRGRAVRH